MSRPMNDDYLTKIDISDTGCMSVDPIHIVQSSGFGDQLDEIESLFQKSMASGIAPITFSEFIAELRGVAAAISKPGDPGSIIGKPTDPGPKIEGAGDA